MLLGFFGVCFGNFSKMEIDLLLKDYGDDDFYI